MKREGWYERCGQRWGESIPDIAGKKRGEDTCAAHVRADQRNEDRMYIQKWVIIFPKTLIFLGNIIVFGEMNTTFGMYNLSSFRSSALYMYDSMGFQNPVRLPHTQMHPYSRTPQRVRRTATHGARGAADGPPNRTASRPNSPLSSLARLPLKCGRS